MTQAQLNLAWMFTTFILAAQQTNAGAFIEADTAYPEINDLVTRKYLKTNKRLLNDGTKVGAVVPAGAYAEDLIADLGLDPVEYMPKIPADLRKPTADQPAVAAEQAAPVAAEQPAAPAVAQVAPTTELPAGTIGEQPQFHDQAAQTAADTTSAAIGGHVAVTTVETVTRRDQNIPIALGVAYVKPQSGLTRARAAASAQEEAYPYKEIVELKVANPTEAPSFHIVGKKSKDVSGMIRRHALKYEASHGVTFRAQGVDATDPNGTGVRVFALFTTEAPKRPERKPKTDTAPAAAPAVEQTV